MAGADDHDLDLIIEEGRRQLDSQRDDYNSIRARAQDRITVTLVTLAFSTAVFARLSGVDRWQRMAATGVWGAGFVLIVIGLGMAASVASAAGSFEVPDTTQLTNPNEYPRPLRESLAKDYANCVRAGAMTVSDRTNALQITTRYVVWGALATAVAFLLAV